MNIEQGILNVEVTELLQHSKFLVQYSIFKAGFKPAKMTKSLLSVPISSYY